MRNKILSLLVLLLTAATGAWAQTTPQVYTSAVAISSLHVGDVLAPGFSLIPASYLDVIYFDDNRSKQDDSPMGSQWSVSLSYIKSYGENAAMTFTTPSDPPSDLTATPVDANGNDGNAWVVTSIKEYKTPIGDVCGIYVSGTYYEPPITVEPVSGKTNEWTLSMPASDVLLTPIYSAATIYRTVGSTETESSYETFKEAFLAAQDGDVIKLDWDVTVTSNTDLSTGNRATDDPVKFTIDFNGYTLDGSSVSSTFIDTQHDGDEITFIDSSPAQTGGLKGLLIGKTNSFVFESGRYSFGDATGGMTVADIQDGWSALANAGWTLADGKEFVDIAGAPDTKGFMVYVDYKTYELTIGAGRFATFYDDYNVKLADTAPTGVGLYTINDGDIDRGNNTVTVTAISGPVEAGTPMLIYNGSSAEKVTLKVTDATANASNPASTEIAAEFTGTAIDKEFKDNDMAAYDYYVLSGGSAFAPVRGTGTISAHKCWLQFDKPSTARSLTIVFDETTGLSEKGIVNSEKFATAEWYDLNGRKLNAAPKRKGVYIRNGQKEVVK